MPKATKILPKKNTFPYIFGLIVVYLIWAAATSVIKITLEQIPPFTFLLYRFIIICTILLPYLFIKIRHTAIHKGDLLKIIILGIFAQSSLFLIFVGLKYTTAIESTIIGLLGPILSVIAGHHFYHEKIDIKVKIGLGLATFGTVFVALEPIMLAGHFDHAVELRLFGNLMVILYSLSFLLYVIWSKITLGQNTKEIVRTLKFLHMKPMKRHYSPIFITVISFYVGLATFIPLALMEAAGMFGAYTFNPATLTLTPILGVLYMALISSIVAYILFEWSMEGAEVKDTAIFSYLQPIMAIPFAYWLLREVPNQYMIIGGVIIALGVLIAEEKKS